MPGRYDDRGNYSEAPQPQIAHFPADPPRQRPDNETNRAPAVLLRSLPPRSPFETDPELGIPADNRSKERPPGTCTLRQYKIIMPLLLLLALTAVLVSVVLVAQHWR
jgi:hypothetical protein